MMMMLDYAFERAEMLKTGKKQKKVSKKMLEMPDADKAMILYLRSRCWPIAKIAEKVGHSTNMCFRILTNEADLTNKVLHEMCYQLAAIHDNILKCPGTTKNKQSSAAAANQSPSSTEETSVDGAE
jgi:hypothetical protein